MKKSRFTEQQVAYALRQADAGTLFATGMVFVGKVVIILSDFNPLPYPFGAFPLLTIIIRIITLQKV
jgi:hypothetical protein